MTIYQFHETAGTSIESLNFWIESECRRIRRNGGRVVDVEYYYDSSYLLEHRAIIKYEGCRL